MWDKKNLIKRLIKKYDKNIIKNYTDKYIMLDISKVRGKASIRPYSKEFEFSQMYKLEILNQLKLATYKNEFEVYYQPKIHTITQQVVGLEALVRWRNHKLGDVSPAEFIPIAEDSGLILDVGRFVWKSVCEQIKEWEEQNIYLKVSINISDKELREERFINYIFELLNRTKVKTSFIEIEISETSDLNELSLVQENIAKFKKAGFGISIDDFGKGFACFGSLNKLPVDTLKIDKSFIDFILVQKKTYEIVRAIIKLAHSLDLLVVAEGVEHKNQYEILRYFNCDFIQGYYFSKPLNKKEIEVYILNNKNGVVYHENF